MNKPFLDILAVSLAASLSVCSIYGQGLDNSRQAPHSATKGLTLKEKAPAEKSKVEIAGLKCQSAINPVSVDTPTPKFSWLAESSARGQRQSAFQLLVSDSREGLSRDKGNLWDSGMSRSSGTNAVRYGGKSLASNQTYFWKVRIWDRDGKPTSFSETASFTTGILDPALWQARWIGRGDGVDPVNADGYYTFSKDRLLTGADYLQGGESTEYDKESFTFDGDQTSLVHGCGPGRYEMTILGKRSIYDENAVLMRKNITLSKPVSKALVHVCGLGLYELMINGKRVGEKVYNPAKTNYSKTVLYDSYDVSALLKEGENVLGLVVGNGWFNSLPKRWNWRAPWYGEKRALLQMHLTGSDGDTRVIGSDGSWKVADGPVRRNDPYDGETYDANMELEGWDKPGFDDSAWANAKTVKPPRGELFAQSMPAIQRREFLKPVSVTRLDGGVVRVDFGQNFAGWIRVRMKAKKGQCIVFRYSEELKNGILNFADNVTDHYIAKGAGQEVFEPRFTQHGFQYVEVSGLDDPLLAEDIEGVVIHSAVEPAGTLNCADERIGRIHAAVLLTQLNNLMGYPTDCPQRAERLGWMGDAHLTAEEAIHNFDMDTFYTKWLRDIRMNQEPNGNVSFIAPRQLMEGSAPSFSSGYHLVAWYHYLYYGDKRVLEDHFEAFKRHVDFLTTRTENDILPTDKYGDWLSEVEGWKKGGPELTSTGFYYYMIGITAKTARILGRADDVKKYESLAVRVKDAFNRRFFNQSGHCYEDGSQFTNGFPLFLGLVPDGERAAVFANLVDDIVNKHGGHLTTGIFGIKYVMELLSREGRGDVAWLLATQESDPGWLNMLKGRTTLTEKWQAGWGSGNHIMRGSIDSWFYKELGGIKIDEDAPGFAKVTINPFMPSGLPWAKVSLKTVRGEFRSEWAQSQQGVELKIRIPVGVEAMVHVRADCPQQVSEGGHPAEKAEGVKFVKMEAGHAVFHVLSGNYDFVSRTPPSKNAEHPKDKMIGDGEKSAIHGLTGTIIQRDRLFTPSKVTRTYGVKG